MRKKYVNEAIKHIRTNNITETNNLLHAARMWANFLSVLSALLVVFRKFTQIFIYFEILE